MWRLFTWPLANEPTIWVVITLAIFWYFGREVEGMVGRVRFAFLLLLLTVIPGIFGVLLDIGIAGLAPVELAVFLIFIAEYPYVRFFFGIPAWAIGAVIVGIQVLQYLGLGEEDAHRPAVRHHRHGRADGPQHGARPEPAVDPQDPVAGLRWRQQPPAPGTPRWRGRRRRAVVGVVAWRPDAGRRSPSRPAAPMASDHDQAELDTLLDKISANGMDGLTADEKRRLNELSKRLRNRR